MRLHSTMVLHVKGNLISGEAGWFEGGLNGCVVRFLLTRAFAFDRANLNCIKKNNTFINFLH